MKTAFKSQNNKIVFKDVELPPLGANDIKLKIKACGICGTDIHTAVAPGADDQKFGHEISGVISEVGCGVKKLKVGDSVALDSATPCGHCDNCRNKNVHLCTDIQSIFYYGYFGFAEELISPAICAIKFDQLTFEEATLQEPLGVALDMVKLAEIKPGMNVLVIGLGPIGLMSLPLIKQAGANKIFVSDFKKQVKRFELAKHYGVEDYIDPSEQDLKNYQFNCRLDRVIVTAPPAVLPTAMEIISDAGIISYIGMGWSNPNVTFNADAFHFKKLQLRASFASPAHYGAEALELLKSKVVDPALFISHTFKLDDLGKAIEAAKSNSALKVVVQI